MSRGLTDKDVKAITSLRDRGFAVAVFIPGELKKADPNDVEDRMVQAGWDAIDYLCQDLKGGLS